MTELEDEPPKDERDEQLRAQFPHLARMQAENRPHLRDPEFLLFMSKVVGNTLRKEA